MIIEIESYKIYFTFLFKNKIILVFDKNWLLVISSNNDIDSSNRLTVESSYRTWLYSDNAHTNIIAVTFSKLNEI